MPLNLTRSVLSPRVLPILQPTNDSRQLHSEWHHYFQSVYGVLVDKPVDLNKFEWFYDSAPLLQHVVPAEFSRKAAYPLPLTEGLVYKYHNFAEDQWARAGNQVYRTRVAAQVSHLTFTVRRAGAFPYPVDSRLEVLRAPCNSERDKAWFALMVGTGVFLDLGEASRRGFAVRKPLFHHNKPEVYLEMKGLTGRTSCGLVTNVTTGQHGHRLPLRSGFDGRSSLCECDATRVVINCGSAGGVALSLPEVQPDSIPAVGTPRPC